jgi:nucleotide-binding universal stress UspA family protein
MKFSKILVALDLSDLDEQLIKYSQSIAATFEATSIEFLHVCPHFVYSEALASSFDSLIQEDLSWTRQVQTDLAKVIQPAFDAMTGIDVNISVTEGKPQEQLIAMVREKQPDVLILGKKKGSEGTGIIARRIARKANCAIWFVPENATPQVKTILVPVDFSEYSARALKAALHFKEKMGEIQITTLHLIELPTTAYNINRNREGITLQLKAAALKSYQRFLSNYQLDEKDFEFKMLFNDEFDVARYIQIMADRKESDLILMGATGHSRFDEFIFGSVTEKLITYEEKSPVLVVR